MAQDIERQLLSGMLAVWRGVAEPADVARGLDDVCLQTIGGSIESASARVISSQAVQSMQQAVDEIVARHKGDTVAALRSCPLDPRLREELIRLRRPEIDQLVKLLDARQGDVAGDFVTLMGREYETINSRNVVAPVPISDPYSTGANLPSTADSLSSAVPVSEPASTSNANTSFNPDKSDAEFATLGTADRTLNQRANQNADSVADTGISESSTGSQESQEAEDARYETLQSGLPSGTPLAGQGQFDAADIPWPLRFRVLRDHAKGGLGKVSVAEDLELHREVAFKEIQSHMADDSEARMRFIQEAEITGSLEHPGIVPVYGLGTHADGRPYYAMRFIRGRSLQHAIEDYLKLASKGADASQQQFEFRQLLRRFVDVCNAIHYAHSRGIIHRDIKPGNVMLGDFGETLVVDWGIAKSIKVRGSIFRTALGRLPQLLSGDGSQTMMGSAIGTPQFMSPEQAEGRLDELGPRSDVYSLGATLYCILTGTVAFTSRVLSDVMQQVVEGTFPPPIEVNSKVPKPLNAICIKAMAKIPALRYETAKDLADDIEHWLADEPVVAYEENRWEKMSRWVRRNQARAQAAGVAGVAIALIAIVAAFLIDHSRRLEAKAKRELKIANDNETEARHREKLAKEKALGRSMQTREAVDTLLGGVGDALDAVPGMQDARKRLLERAAQDYAKLTQETNPDPDLQAEAARSLMRLAGVRLELNELEKARDALKKAENIWKSLLAQSPKEVKYLLEQARTDIQFGQLESRADKVGLAGIHFQSAISALELLIREQGSLVDYQDALGSALIGLAVVDRQTAKSVDRGRHLQRAVNLYHDLQKQNPNDVRVWTSTARAENSFARYLLDSGRAVEAVDMLNGCIEIHDALVADFPNDPDLFARRAAARVVLAEALRSLGRWSVVVANDQACVADFVVVVQARPDVPRYRQELAIARANLGQALRRLGDNVKAAKALQESLDTFNELTTSYPIPDYFEGAADVQSSLALVQSELGQQDAALQLIDTAITDYQELLNSLPESTSYQDDLGLAQSNKARILSRRGETEKTVKQFEESIATLKGAADKDPKTPRYADHLATAWTQLGLYQASAENIGAAREAFQTAIKMREDIVKNFKGSPLFQDSLAWLLATCAVEDLRNAKRSLELSQMTTQLFPDSTQHWQTHGAGLLQSGNHEEALAALDKSLQLRTQDEGMTLALKAVAESKLKQPEAAKKSLAAAKAWKQKQKPADEELSRWIQHAEETVNQK